MRTANGGRVDSTGKAYAGSQRQLQLLVREQPVEFATRVIEAIGLPRPAEITWVSPLESDGYEEYRDADFLKVVGLPHEYERLKAFWPARGPVWDGLGILHVDGGAQRGVVLVEAKSHPPECLGTHCKATSESRLQIEAALRSTKSWARATAESCWLTDVYQYANRIAHLYFLRELASFPAYLVYVYFTNDPRTPTNEATWQYAREDIKRRLGLPPVSIPGLIELVLAAPERPARHGE